MGQAFSSCINLTSVYLPECSLIGNVSTTFKGCTHVSNVTLGVSSLTNENFPLTEAKSTITELHFPHCMTIDQGTFGGSAAFISDAVNGTQILESYTPRYPNLSVADFPACTSVSKYAFYVCVNLTSISLPVCTSIGFEAFGLCLSLSSINLPACETIQYEAFEFCSSLTSVNLPACSYIGGHAFSNCTSLTSISLPACITISSYVFNCCTNLTSIDLPVCSYISSGAFSGCTNLISITLRASSIPTLYQSNTFINTPIVDSTYTGHFGSIYVPASLVSAYKVASYWSDIADRITAIPT